MGKRDFVRFVFNPLWPSYAIERQRSGSTLAQTMVSCPTAPIHYLNQYWICVSYAGKIIVWNQFTKIVMHLTGDNDLRKDSISYVATLPSVSYPRLLHSPSLVTIGPSMGFEIWPPIGWHHPFVIGWPKDRLGLPSAPLDYGLTWPVGFPTAIQIPVTVPLRCSNGRQLPAVRAVQRDCERV